MSLVEIHATLANTPVLFIAALGIWALVLRFTNRPIDGAWFGAAMLGELLIIAEGALGGILYLQGGSAALPRPFMHILYGVVAVITLPAAHSFFGNLEDEKVKSLAMAAACFFLWGILLRASFVATFEGPIF